MAHTTRRVVWGPNPQVGVWGIAVATLAMSTGFGGVPVDDSKPDLRAPSIAGPMGMVVVDDWAVVRSPGLWALGWQVGVASSQGSVPEEQADSLPEILREIRWTVAKPGPLDAVARAWGIERERLRELNPDLDAVGPVPAGARLLVHRLDGTRLPRSIGAPNRGRLEHATPMPEGPWWRLRDVRHRAFATELTVSALVDAFTSFGRAFPDASPVPLGELSARRGGRIEPHASHQTGRDADIGYVLSGPVPRWGFRTATVRNFDAAKTWHLVRSLLDTGRVQRIFVGSKVLGWLRSEALRGHDSATVRSYFLRIQPWPGHDDHMHVRFVCQPDQPSCIPESMR